MCTKAASPGEIHIGSGRVRLQGALYMPSTIGATRYSPMLKSLYERLTKRGNTAKIALIACARKLLIIANAVVTRGTLWEDRSTTAV